MTQVSFNLCGASHLKFESRYDNTPTLKLLFGLQQCEKFGKKETIRFSIARTRLFSRWWTKL